MGDIVSPLFLERDRALKWEVQEKGTTELRESSWLRKDASAVNVEVWNTVIRSPDGQPVAMMGVATNVTERNQARKALEESEERYRFLFENAPVGNITTVSRTVTAANPEAAKIFGLTLEELIGRDLLSLYAPTPDGYDKALETREAFNTSEDEWSDEFRMQRGDGRMIWVKQSRRTVVNTYGVAEHHGTVIDITREKEAEAALRRSEERYHAIYDKLQEGILQIGRQGIILGANQAFGEMMGYSIDEVVATSFYRLAELGKREEIPGIVQRMFEGEEFPPAETLLVRKDDTRLPVEIATTLIKDRLGNPEAILMMVRNLHRQRETQQVNRELAIMEERTRFAREIHDTVAQTLTGLVSQLDAVASIVSSDQEQLHDKLLVARGLASACLDQTRTALLDLKPSELRPGGLTDAIRAEIEGLKQRGLPVELKTHGIEPVSTHEDNAVALYRIIQESLSNAFKHAKASQVIVDLIFGPDDAVVEISDNGVGFDTRARRLEANTSTTGFGMGVMHERAHVAGGELTVISARGTGTRVIGRIPYTLFSPTIQEQLPEPIMVSADALLELGPCRVLLVDDHELVRRGTRALVEMADDMIVVGEAATGDGALTLAQELEPDIILMDIHMPSKGGIEATKELTVSLPQCKVILLTVYDDDDHVREGIRAGAKGYLIKGATKEEIINGIRTVHAGGSLVPSSLVAKLAEPHRSDLPDLSGREREVLLLLADGSSTKEIGEELALSLNTVNFHLRNLYQKLGVRSRTQAIKVGQQAGLLDVAKYPLNIG